MGWDYRYQRLANYVDLLTYGDGSDVAPPARGWGARSRESAASASCRRPLLPAKLAAVVDPERGARRGGPVHLSVLANEANRPTAALKIELPGGLSLRASIATSTPVSSPVVSAA
jgi:hypothetical protein